MGHVIEKNEWRHKKKVTSKKEGMEVAEEC